MRPALALTLTLLAALGCSHPAPPSEPAMPKKPEPPPVTAPRAPEPSSAKPATPAADRTPIKVDLTKVKWGEGPAELFGWDDGESRLFFYTNGTAEFVVAIPAEGEYQIVVTASSQPALNEHAKFKVAVDGQPAGSETTCTSEDAKDYAIRAKLSAGERRISVSFTNDVYKENEYDRNFFLNGLKVVREK